MFCRPLPPQYSRDLPQSNTGLLSMVSIHESGKRWYAEAVVGGCLVVLGWEGGVVGSTPWVRTLRGGEVRLQIVVNMCDGYLE